ncbi:D-alanyl-D-alanine carboxypeptidase family protein [Metabacillus herbersteinensis]|uniref:D-alanyl-D-alanine carboxypeptidase family protein n=1 Tax=Metabacillus herbersteinensis TaxID=283816 RepID=A0ABV6GB38_9BACI
MQFSRILLIFLILLGTIPKVMVAENNQSNLQLISEAAVLIDATSGEVLFEKEPDKLMYPASITKIATAIYAIEKGHLDDVVTVSENARNADGTKVYLEEGEQVPLKKLIQGLLINSGNDAGVAIAEHLSGNVEDFSKDLTAFLKEKTNVSQTTFKNPHGLFDPEHQTTAEDMAVITQYAMKNDTFREISSTIELDWKGETWDTTIINHHRMLRDWPYEGVTGGKNGFVNQSGFTLVTTAQRDHIELIAVTLKTSTEKQSYEDTAKLLDFGFENFESEKITETAEFIDKAENRYQLIEPLYYTKKRGESVVKEISTDGNLLIKNEDGEVIFTHPLEKVNDPETSEQILSETVESPPEDNSLNQHLRWVVSVSILSVLVLVGFFFTQIRKI